MPLDTSTYHLALLRLDGRRWNELRRIHAQISTQASADGSSYLEMGNTKVICTVAGPAEVRGGGGAGRREGAERDNAVVQVEVGIAGFSGVERKRRNATEMQNTIASAFTSTLFTHLYPHSTITITLHILSQDGSLLAACLNAATLALIDAGIPMSDYIVACTSGLTPPAPSSQNSNNTDDPDPLLDLNGMEEQELAFMTVGTVGAGERVSVCVMERRVQVGRLEGMLAVGVDGCRQVREILDGVVRRQGKRVLESVIS
ncbi:Exosome non-catalytic core component [Mycoblastus sanguinarius]|nr:Exosome non-catalytic core component [Mycoblastus sanguinarius]